MPINETVTSVLYKLYSGEVIPGFYQLPDNLKQALSIAEDKGLVKWGTNYQLTVKGKMLVMERKTYDDFLNDHLPPKPQSPTLNNHLPSETEPFKTPIHEISLADLFIINAHRAVQLRDAGLLDNDLPRNNSHTPRIVPHKTKVQIGTSLIKNLKKLSIINIIEMIVAGLIVAWAIWYFGFNAVKTP